MVSINKLEDEVDKTRMLFQFENKIHFVPVHVKIVTTEEDVDANTPTSNLDESNDHFEQLRIAREKERLERQKQKIARSVSQQTGGGVILDSDQLIEQLTKSDRNSYIEQST